MKTEHNVLIKNIDQKYKNWLSGEEKPDLFYSSVMFPRMFLLFFFIALTIPIFLLYLTLNEEIFRISSWIIIAVVSLPPIFLLLHYYKQRRLIRLVKSGDIILGIFVDSESILYRVDEHKCSIILARDIEDISLVEIVSENVGRRYELHINKNNPLLQIAHADFDFDKSIINVQKNLDNLLDY